MAWGLSSLLAGYFISPVPPGGLQLYRPSSMGRKRRVQPEGLEQSKSSARAHNCREGRHNTPPTHTHTFLKLFQAAWPHLGLLTVEANLPLQRLIRKKIPFACPPFPLGPRAGTSSASACKPQCIQTSPVQHILVFSTPPYGLPWLKSMKH